MWQKGVGFVVTDKTKIIISWLQLFFNRIPDVENNTIVDNSNLRNKIFNKPRKYNDLYNVVQNRTTISNKSNRKKVINNASVFIEKLGDYQYEDIILNYGLDNQIFYIYAINDGNLNSEEKLLRIESYIFKDGGYEDKVNFFDIPFDLSGGEIKIILEDELKLRSVFKSNKNYSKLIFKVNYNGVKQELATLFYSREQDMFFLGGMGNACSNEKINLLELKVDDYQEQYVFNSLDFSIDKNSTGKIDMFILPSKSCKIDYYIEYYYNGKKLKNCNRCRETTVVKVPQFSLESRCPIQMQGKLFDFLIDNKIKNYRKGDSEFIDNQIGYNYEDFKKYLKIHSRAE